MTDGLLTRLREPHPGVPGSTWPTTEFGYDGPDGQLNWIEDAEYDVARDLRTHGTTIDYDPATYRVREVINPDSTNQEIRRWQFTPLLADGLVEQAIRRPVPTRESHVASVLAIPAPETAGAGTLIQARATSPIPAPLPCRLTYTIGSTRPTNTAC